MIKIKKKKLLKYPKPNKNNKIKFYIYRKPFKNDN